MTSAAYISAVKDRDETPMMIIAKSMNLPTPGSLEAITNINTDCDHSIAKKTE
jgi:hypothetical protein